MSGSDTVLLRITNLERQMRTLHSDGGDDTSGGMDVLSYRMDQYEKRADAADQRMARVESLLTEIRVELARKPTTGSLWGMVATTVGVAVAMVALFVGILTYLQAFHLPH